MVALRNESKPLRDGDIWAATGAAGKIRAKAAASPRDRGACACGRHIVARFECTPCGNVELHSRRRCMFRKSNSVIAKDIPLW